MNSNSKPDVDEAENRRASARVPFASILGIADYNGTLPDHSEFRPVKGRDLSHTGIAFHTQKWPTSDSIVVMVGDRKNPSYASANIVGCLRNAADPDDHQFEVRCEFERWLQPHR